MFTPFFLHCTLFPNKCLRETHFNKKCYSAQELKSRSAVPSKSCNGLLMLYNSLPLAVITVITFKLILLGKTLHERFTKLQTLDFYKDFFEE